MTGLVFGGGGVKGSYQVGSYLAFKKCGIKIDGIVGASIGSFNAAMIVSGMEKELYEFWKNVNVGELLNFNAKYVDSVNNNEKFKEFIYGLEQMTTTFKSKGIDSSNIKNILAQMIDEEKIRKSKMDYGLITVRLDDLKPLYLFKEDMKEGKIPEYILASCNLPLFKKVKLIDNKYYADGGWYDNTPINMLLSKGYDKIYSIEIQGLGFSQKVKDKSKVIKISSNRYLGSMLSVNKKKIYENLKLGYYDTLKVLKSYDGYNFIFKKHSTWVYNTLMKSANNELVEKAKKYFKAKNNKELIIKAIEYIMVKEDYTYFKIYNIFKEIKNVKKLKNKHFVYELVRSIKII